jgi:beta-lactamase class D
MKVKLHRILVCKYILYEEKKIEYSNLDLDDDDDDSLMRQVLAMSQIEYVETLKKQQEQSSKFVDPNQPSSSTDTPLL